MTDDEIYAYDAMKRDRDHWQSMYFTILDLQCNATEIAERRERENARLRAVFPKVLEALGNGAGCTPDVSMEFIESIPQEIRLFLANAVITDPHMERVSQAAKGNEP